MKYFAVFLPMKDQQKSQEYRQQHLDYLAQRNSEGKIFARGRFVDGAGGLVVYIAESEQEVQQWVGQDPYVALGARGFEIHEWDLVTDAVLPSKF
ncbi:YciI family protein [Paenibacillus sp. TAB 01]|uniref:YciI family protein n=1 Tax=Paenibacillus sp. TAB 01 TaxID=3368988 RepID=UPI0037530300